MYKIYLENRSIVICPPDDPAANDPNTVRIFIGDAAEIPALVDYFENNTSLARICIPSENVEGMYRDICRTFLEVNAAGGLVTNRRGDFLLIKRNGLWDLPKGHQDPGEDIRTTALREVSEETGIEDLELGDLICITDHCYRRNGIRHLKHTWWFRMQDNQPMELVPQSEEDISKAAWVAKSSLPPFLQNTYSSIAEVFRHIF
jgi:ADP-ribose pyrophosphatase YjhB (NUDIX family)